ncbi:NmrA family protein [Weissella oryzae SG25]|uniref:NmrA family protein n=1 Tax=Weissella oryzae (strain DSM 25784 / JCM 18191 / LMG 30913 / SG25) TaxID=1329250 RepID=A0A069CS81_WEIOS|nr:NAD(P)H-binding protein [Weissella oryzae]GAK30680.1 NmrA family protein [Weissella oryzae SG25]
MNYLVTGASGHFGQAALKQLSKIVDKQSIFALVRNTAKGAALSEQGYNVRLADYNDSEALASALMGIDRLLLVSGAPGNRQAEHGNVIQAAKTAKLDYIVYTSFPEAPNADNMLAPDHAATEQMIKDSGIAHTFVRNNWYLENELPLIKIALADGSLPFTAGTGRTGWALRREYAAAAANVLVQKPEQTVLDFSGPVRTYTDLAAGLASAVQKPITAKAVSSAEFAERLSAFGMDQGSVDFFLAVQKIIADGQLDFPSDDLAQALGEPLADLPVALKELLAD